ncbi:PREDICTED: fibronectin type III domain-containing protein 1 isoform X2 [Gavialis gangeticus]|uniref:fibronectin type III domain-containing protein 1 isoform X2 n=1 Tax=Gavialis gangeticus TaxID=94835 RepID=UPI00092E4191|nr:PREDICTED: fibronectin type III domain-containing protein 1 isoform X2 [Gavialis gangeticus]
MAPVRALLLPCAALLLLLLLLPAACPAFPEKDVPSRPLRMRMRSSDDKSPVRWRSLHSSGLRSPHRLQRYPFGYGESRRKMSYSSPSKDQRNQEAKKLASESVYVVSVPSRNSQGRNQPLYRSALTKRKVTEEEELEVAKDISVRVMSSQSVLVAWTDPVYEKQKKVVATRQYTVRYREKGESARWDYKQVPNRRVLVDNLMPDAMYEFAVRISEGEKEGAWSISVYQRTPEAAPASAPENLDVWPVSGKPTSVTASWEPLSESEGKVKEYILSYAPALKPFGAKSITYPGSTTSAIIDGLQPGERYIFKIRAANRRGQGPQSKAFSVAIPATIRGDLDVHQKTNIQDDLESKKSGNAAPSSPSQTSSVSSQKLSTSSKHTAAHSSSSVTGTDKNSHLSEFKNKLLAGSGVLNKSQLSSKKTAELEPDPQATEVTDEHDSSNETPTTLPKTQDQRRHVRLLSPSRPFHSVHSSGRMPVRSRTPSLTRQMNTDKHGSSSTSSSQRFSSSSSASSSIPKYTDNETKRLRQENANTPPSPKNPSDNLPGENVHNDLLDSVKEKQAKLDSVPFKDTGSSKTPSRNLEHTHLALPSSRQLAVSHKVVQSHRTKPDPATGPVESPTSSSPNSQSHSHHPSSKLVHSHNDYDSKETRDRDENSNSRLSSHDGGSSPSPQKRLPIGSKPHVSRDPNFATAAVSARTAVSVSASHSSTHSRFPFSANHKSVGRDVSNDGDNDSEDSEAEHEKKRPDSSVFRSRSSLGQSTSERFNLPRHKSSQTANRFLNRVGIIPESRLQPSKLPYSTISSKVHPQSSGHLTSSSKSSSNTDKELEEEKPLPSTITHDPSPSTSRESSAVYSKRRSSQVDVSTRRREPYHSSSEDEHHGRETEATPTSHSLSTVRQSSLPGQSSSSARTNHQVTSVQDPGSRTSSSTSASTGSSSGSATSKHQRGEKDNKEVKETLAKSKQTMPLSKKPLTESSHFSSQKTLHSESSSSQRARPSQSQLQSSLNSRDQSNEKLQEDVDVVEEEARDRVYGRSVFPKVISSKRIPTSLSQGSSTSSLSKQQQSGSQTSNAEEKHKSRQDPITSFRGSSSSLPVSRHTGSRVTTSGEQMPDSHKPSSSYKHTRLDTDSLSDASRASQHSGDTSLSSKSSSTSMRPNHPTRHSYSRIPTRTASQTEKKYSQFLPKPSKVESSPKDHSLSLPKSRQTVSNEDDDYSEHDQREVEEKPASSSAARWSSSISRGKVASDKRKMMESVLPRKVSSVEEEREEGEDVEPSHLKHSLPASSASSASVASRVSQSPSRQHTPSKPSLVWPHLSPSMSGPSQPHPTHAASPAISSSSSPSLSPRQRLLNSRLRSPSQRQFIRPPYRQGYNGRPNLTTKTNGNGKPLSGNNGKPTGQKIINGPQGTKWIVDLDRGLVLNTEGRFLQDSQGNPLRVKLGGDGRTIVDEKGAPLVSPDGLPLFGHGRFSKPVANAQDKPIISLGGKPLIGLEMVKKTTPPPTTTTPTTTTTTTTTTATTTTTTTTTTTPEPTTTEPPTEKPQPTCPPGTYAQYDDDGSLVLGSDGLPECSLEDSFSGMDSDVTATPEAYVIYDEDYEFFESTLLPTTTTIATTTSTTEAVPEIVYPETSVVGSSPLSEFDLSGKKRFTAPYVTYLNKDPAVPCSLTEALEHFQVESLDELIPNDLKEREMLPQKAPYNITVVAVEGCHSFVIIDWAKPLQGDMVTGYLVYSASYDDFLKNKWSTRTAGTTHLPIENLKPNTRYYFKVQAKNPYGFGPVSSSVSFVTESDNPLLIVRPPGGEPIWIPFTFKYDPTYSDCSGKQYVKRTWYRKFVGVVLCNSLRYKIYLSDDLKDTFYGIGDSWGRGEDHCQFVDSHMDGRTGPQSYVEALPTIRGYYRQFRQEPVSFGRIGHTTPYYYVGWYECGVPIPGKW